MNLLQSHFFQLSHSSCNLEHMVWLSKFNPAIKVHCANSDITGSFILGCRFLHHLLVCHRHFLAHHLDLLSHSAVASLPALKIPLIFVTHTDDSKLNWSHPANFLFVLRKVIWRWDCLLQISFNYLGYDMIYQITDNNSYNLHLWLLSPSLTLFNTFEVLEVSLSAIIFLSSIISSLLINILFFSSLLFLLLLQHESLWYWSWIWYD